MKNVEELKNFVFEPKWSYENDNNFVKKDNKTYKKRERKLKHIPVFDFRFYIDQKTTAALKSILRKDGITRKVNTVVEEILVKKRYNISVKWKKEQKKFLKLYGENKFFLHEFDIFKYIIKSKKRLKIVNEYKTKIAGNFDHILKCNKTRQLFPPTSHDLFKNMIDSNILEKCLDISRKDYIEQLEKISDTSMIKSFKENEIWKKVLIMDDEKVNGLESIKNKIKQNKNGIYFSEVGEIKDSAVNIYNNKNLNEIVKELAEMKQNQIFKSLYSNLILISKKANLYLNKKCKSLFVSAYPLKKVKINNLNLRSTNILNFLSSHKNSTIKNILNDKHFVQENKSVILKEIRWLIESGYIRQYDTGCLETMIAEKK